MAKARQERQKAEKKEPVRYRQHRAKYGVIYPGLSEHIKGESMPLCFHQTAGSVTRGKSEWIVNNIIPAGVYIQSKQGKERKLFLNLIDLVEIALDMGIDDPKIQLKLSAK